MPLSDEQDEQLELILDGLEAVRGQLYPNARSFVDDQIERHAKYGKQMFLSAKQEKWLRDLYKEFVGTEPEAVGTNQEPQAAARNDIDDERDKMTHRDVQDYDDEIPF